MAVPSSLTLNYNAILSTTLFNYRKQLEDCISASNAFFWVLMKKQREGYVGLSDVGERAAIPLMYEFGTADSYEGYDVLSVEPIDGLTMAFYEWRQCAIPISISGREELINSGQPRLINLLKTKVRQAENGIQEFFGKALLRGAGGSSVIEPYTSATNGSTFVDPIAKLVRKDPTTSAVIGNINQNTYSWWQNQAAESGQSGNYSSFLSELDHMYNTCSAKAGGSPNLFLTDQATFEFYVRVLRSFYQNPSFREAELPFDNVLLKGKPLVWDEYCPNAYAGSETQSTAEGTIYFLNTKFWQVQYHTSRNFAPTNMQQPENQDARVSHLLWFGAALCSNRRKQGVLHRIKTTITS